MKKTVLILLLSVLTLFTTCIDMLFDREEKDKTKDYYFINETQYKITINIYTPFREAGSGTEKTGIIEVTGDRFNTQQKIIYSDYEEIEYDWTVEYKRYVDQSFGLSPNGISEERVVSEIRGRRITFKYYSNAHQAGLSVPSSGSLAERNKYSEEYWGEWITDIGSVLYISNMDMYYYDNGEYSGKYVNNPVIERISPNVLKMTDYYYYSGNYGGTWENPSPHGVTDYLFASRIPNGSFNGRVVNDTASRSVDAARAISGIGSIDVVVSNLNNSANAQTTKTDGDGNFEVAGVIPGDTYEVTVGDKSIPVISNTNNEDIGNVMIKDGINFKASISDPYILTNTSMGEERKELVHIYGLYINATYYLDINLNIINANAYNGSCTYQLTLPAGLTSTSALSGAFSPNGNGNKIPINLTCVNVNNEYEYKKIGIQITANRMTWEDSVSIKFYSEKTRIILYTSPAIWEVYVNLIVRTPHADTFTHSNFGSTSFILTNRGEEFPFIDVPKCSGDDYFVMLIKESQDDAMYNISLDRMNAITPNFDNLTSDEEYNSEYNAKTISPNDIVRSYIHGNEPVFYKFRF